MNYVAKVELFRAPLARLAPLTAPSTCPIRRSESDEDAMETARLVVERGRAIYISRGTGSAPARWRTPSREWAGVLQAGRRSFPPLSGTEHVRRGWRVRPRKVKVRLGRAMTFPRAGHPSPALAENVTARIWPNVQLQWEDLGGLPPMRRAAVIGAGSWGTAQGVAVLLAHGIE